MAFESTPELFKNCIRLDIGTADPHVFDFSGVDAGEYVLLADLWEDSSSVVRLAASDMTIDAAFATCGIGRTVVSLSTITDGAESFYRQTITIPEKTTLSVTVTLGGAPSVATAARIGLARIRR